MYEKQGDVRRDNGSANRVTVRLLMIKDGRVSSYQVTMMGFTAHRGRGSVRLVVGLLHVDVWNIPLEILEWRGIGK